MYVCRLLYSQIKTLGQTGLPDIPMSDLLLVQSYYSQQMILSSQDSILNSRFNQQKSLLEGRQQVLQHYLAIMTKSVELLECYEQTDNSSLKAQEIRTNIIEKILKADNFQAHHLS